MNLSLREIFFWIFSGILFLQVTELYVPIKY